MTKDLPRQTHNPSSKGEYAKELRFPPLGCSYQWLFMSNRVGHEGEPRVEDYDALCFVGALLHLSQDCFVAEVSEA